MSKEVRILIVEDEFMISEDISMRLSDFGYLVEGVASSAEQALKILEQNPVDLALLDVNIDGDMDGIELSQIIAKKYNIPFIFLTSLASRTIVERAKEANPSAYLLKPFNDRQVQIAIEMALTNFAEHSTHQHVEQKELIASPVIQIRDSLFLKKDSHFVRVLFSDIIYLTSESNYTTIVTKSGKYVYATVLKRFEEKLPGDIFIRVHRSYVVNINCITGFEGNNLHLGSERVPVSKQNRDDFFKNFEIV
ncbi:MAG: LytR/AlgR family response regulator transcription factor [Prolixibacteraceae bacterium]